MVFVNTDTETHELFVNKIAELNKLKEEAIPDESESGGALEDERLPLTFGE